MKKHYILLIFGIIIIIAAKISESPWHYGTGFLFLIIAFIAYLKDKKSDDSDDFHKPSHKQFSMY